MNILEIKIEEQDFDYDSFWVANIYIDGQKLNDIIYKESSRMFYGILPNCLYEKLINPLSQEIYSPNFIAVLQCGCGCEICGDFILHVEQHTEYILWNKLEMARETFDFSHLQFTFSIKNYNAEIEKLKNWVEKN